MTDVSTPELPLASAGGCGDGCACGADDGLTGGAEDSDVVPRVVAGNDKLVQRRGFVLTAEQPKDYGHV